MDLCRDDWKSFDRVVAVSRGVCFSRCVIRPGCHDMSTEGEGERAKCFFIHHIKEAIISSLHGKEESHQRGQNKWLSYPNLRRSSTTQ